MPSLPGVNHQRAVKALMKAGFRIMREGKHITMTDGERVVVIPRANPVNAITMDIIIRGAGLTVEQFKELL
jgi:predicted RNA binding protein YcfA (HicA-like mRNA interferase family)